MDVALGSRSFGKSLSHLITGTPSTPLHRLLSTFNAYYTDESGSGLNIRGKSEKSFS